MKGHRSVSKVYKSNVGLMEQQKVKKSKEIKRDHPEPKAEGEVPRGGGKKSDSMRKPRQVRDFLLVRQPPQSSRSLRYVRRECFKAQLKFVRDE